MKRAPTKRKLDSDQSRSPMCIVHVDGIRHGELHLLSELKDAEGKLAKLQDVKAKRLTQPPSSSYMMKDTCDLIPQCTSRIPWYPLGVLYKRFTMNLDRLKPTASTSQGTDALPQRASRTSLGDKILFKPDCIFCGSEDRKKVKVQGRWTSQE